MLLLVVRKIFLEIVRFLVAITLAIGGIVGLIYLIDPLEKFMVYAIFEAADFRLVLAMIMGTGIVTALCAYGLWHLFRR